MTVSTMRSDARSMCGIQKLLLAKPISYETPLPSKGTYSARYHRSQRDNPREGELTEGEFGGARVETQSHVSVPHVVPGGGEFQMFGAWGASLLDADSQRWLGRMWSKDRNRFSLLHLITALLRRNIGGRGGEMIPNMVQIPRQAMRLRRREIWKARKPPDLARDTGAYSEESVVIQMHDASTMGATVTLGN